MLVPWKETARSFANARPISQDEMEPDSDQAQHEEEKARLSRLQDRILRDFVSKVIKNRPLE
jgi:ClpP class serine protease